MSKKINVLSLFGGIECGRVAMDRLGWDLGQYFSSEVDTYPIEITKKNWPDIIHVGSVTDVFFKENTGGLYWGAWESQPVGSIDILIGGSPCQDLSIAKAGWKGLEGEKSWLFYEYVRILEEVQPKYFILENVASMKKADRDEITRIIGVEPIMINSNLLSAQNRKRLYWVGRKIEGGYEKVEVQQPEDRWILLSDILEDIPLDDKRWKPLDEKYITEEFIEKIKKSQSKFQLLTEARTEEAKQIRRELRESEGIDYCPRRAKTLLPRTDNKSNCITTGVTKELMVLTSNMGTGGNAEYDLEYYWRKLTPIECERLQTLPDNYTACVSNSRRYKAIGNGWTVEVIKHILSHCKF